MPPGTNYRILSLDGGGSWALIQARALQEIYGDIPGHEVLKDFDLAAANSGGSIVLACLIENMTLSQIGDFFKDEKRRSSVFVELPLLERITRIAELGPKYKASAKIDGLRGAFPTTAAMPLTELSDHVTDSVGHSPDFLIASFDYDRLRAAFFRSNIASLASSGPPAYIPVLAEAVTASTNAPVNYFDKPVTFGGSRYWDGGVGGNNNPVLVAVTEARANGAVGTIKVLSLGTGTVRLPMAGDRGVQPPIADEREASSLAHDIQLMASAIIDDPPDAASFIAHVALGQPLPALGGPPVTNGDLVRLSPLVQPVLTNGVWALPTGYDDEAFEWIANLDMDAVKSEQIDWIWRLSDAWFAGHILNQAIRADRDFQCQIGHRFFAEGRDAWKAEVGR
jgi:hypothetical protein